MSQEVRSVAVFDVLPNKERECLQWLLEFYSMLRRKNYSRDVLLRDPNQPLRYINVRFWTSEDARSQAQEDPEVHRYWLRLPELMDMLEIYERLEVVPGFSGEKEPIQH